MIFIQRLNYKHALIFLFLLSVFLLALCKIEDGDAWMHLSLGKVIWQLKGLPAKEPYVYTSLDKPFSYSAWLFGVTYYLSYLLFNVYGVILLKAITITTAFYILVRDSLRPYKNYIIAIIVMAVIVMMARNRFVERPDTFMMVFLSFSIFSLNAYVYDNKKYIYLLPFVHMLWANSHSSIAIMFVPFAAFIFGGILQGYLNRKLSTDFNTLTLPQLKTITLIFIASFAASLINPYFTDQYFYGTQSLISPISQYYYGDQSLPTQWLKQEILELQPPTWQTTKWPYLMTAFVLLSFFLNRKRFSIIYFFLTIPFIILSFTAMRFIFLLGIIAGPILVRNLSAFVDSRAWNDFFSKRVLIAIAVIWLIFYTAFSLIQVRPFDNPEQAFTFGLGINYDFVPEGALRYMDKNNITGRMFHSYREGSYINWRDFPKRSVFVDPRWYIPEDLLEKMGIVSAKPLILDGFEKSYGFESILMQYPPFKTETPEAFSDVDIGISHPSWALVYWDDQSLLYLKRGGRYDSVIQKDEYHFVKPASGVYSVKSRLRDENVRANIIKELKRNIDMTGSSKANAILGFVYNEIGLYNDAINAFSRVRDFPFLYSHLIDAYNGFAYAYAKLGYLDESIRYYRKSLKIKKDAPTLYNIGLLYIQKDDKRAAMKYLEKALKLKPDFIVIYPFLISIYQEFGMKDEVRKTTEMNEKVKLIKEGKEHFKNGLKAYLEGSPDVAIEEYKRSIEADPANPASYTNLGFIYIDRGLFDKAYEYHKKAVDIDPRFADAHYGLALIYKTWGDTKMEKKHWEEYLRIKPAGYYSRRARKRI